MRNSALLTPHLRTCPPTLTYSMQGSWNLLLKEFWLEEEEEEVLEVDQAQVHAQAAPAPLPHLLPPGHPVQFSGAPRVPLEVDHLGSLIELYRIILKIM